MLAVELNYSFCCFILVLQLNFARFEKVLKGLKKKTTNIQVVGFCDSDTYQDVLEKAAKGLGIDSYCKLSLVCSGGVVPETDICGNNWSLGEYIRYNGGTSNRSKKVWGVLVKEDEGDPFGTLEQVRKMFYIYTCSCTSLHFH